MSKSEEKNPTTKIRPAKTYTSIEYNIIMLNELKENKMKQKQDAINIVTGRFFFKELKGSSVNEWCNDLILEWLNRTPEMRNRKLEGVGQNYTEDREYKQQKDKKFWK